MPHAENTIADPQSYFDWRLHHRPRRRLGSHRVTRRFAMRLARGRTQVIHNVDRSVLVRCASGSAWVTHDGDPRDVILDAMDDYRADREAPLAVHALQDCVLEFEFEDEADPRGLAAELAESPAT